jgi:mannitol/fructose-specific phosphotransferase system IIA component (Ntr-type)/predicted RNA-binding Zn-ribbon protein involved in translation (DUF1610 family)
MIKIINHLVQLQELHLARSEQEVAQRAGNHLAQLDQSIDALLGDLPEDVRRPFVRMQQKDPLAIVPITEKNCSACGMGLPTSLVQAVRMAAQLHHCPNCGRLLYATSAAPRRIAASLGRRRNEPPKVGIERFSSPELMLSKLAATDRDGAILELCNLMQSHRFIDSAERLCEEALNREAIVSTAVDHGLAFPHVRGVEGGGLTLALGISEKGLRFGGPARTLTRIVFLLVIPTAASAFYLKLLAGLTQAFHKEEARKKLLAADQPDALWKALLKTTKSCIS